MVAYIVTRDTRHGHRYPGGQAGLHNDPWRQRDVHPIDPGGRDVRLAHLLPTSYSGGLWLVQCNKACKCLPPSCYICLWVGLIKIHVPSSVAELRKRLAWRQEVEIAENEENNSCQMGLQLRVASRAQCWKQVCVELRISGRSCGC